MGDSIADRLSDNDFAVLAQLFEAAGQRLQTERAEANVSPEGRPAA